MSTKLIITVRDQSLQHYDLDYELVENRISLEWIKKIKHLQKVPFCKYYANNNNRATEQQLNQDMAKDIIALNDLINFGYDIKEAYDQNDCNALHASVVSTQYDYLPEVREIFHNLHRKLHNLENKRQKKIMDYIDVSWGEKEGLLKTTFSVPPYDLYQIKVPGNVYLSWSEFGKTPYQYWKDRDLNDRKHFFLTCKPHLTFRSQFNISLVHTKQEFETEFQLWFNYYREDWESKYGCDWNPLYEWGGIHLARPISIFNWNTINDVTAIKIV